MPRKAIVLDQTTMTEVYRKVWTKENPHGDFLTAFAEAYVRADDLNKVILWDAAAALCIKYDLARVEDND